ncbi:MAG: 23S rRNA (pseudouridine(1915)-N(3))-methyltransferase RlmH [Clostridia bacterium]|nr:23S rRNA (pseudouridine(1915)-N(3))-methyltransferase RlmH [Clostridia bacterium]
MMKINVVCVGKIKEKYYEDAVNEYLKRLTRFAKVTVKELKEVNFNAEPTKKDIQDILQKEGEEIKKNLSGTVAVLAIEGKGYNSCEFAKLISAVKDTVGELTLVIGGSYGIDDSVKRLADYKISFSEMTFPHTLTRVILTEQLYRAFTILNDGKYHK